MSSGLTLTLPTEVSYEMEVFLSQQLSTTGDREADKEISQRNRLSQMDPQIMQIWSAAKQKPLHYNKCFLSTNA